MSRAKDTEQSALLQNTLEIQIQNTLEILPWTKTIL